MTDRLLASEHMNQAIMYSRTQNDNGTFNTRCLDCFMTIASAVETEEELCRLEARHICPERALSEMLRKGIRAQRSDAVNNGPKVTKH